ncbi:MAG: hypothetical protein Q8P57_05245 [Candidatus Pacearchaeota archaeon]|nr:hypothetical protein [Candidatus Pacearchaeota archaeon]
MRKFVFLVFALFFLSFVSASFWSSPVEIEPQMANFYEMDIDSLGFVHLVYSNGGIYYNKINPQNLSGTGSILPGINTAVSADVIVDSMGNALVEWDDYNYPYNNIMFNRFDSSGNPLMNNTLLVSQSNPAQIRSIITGDDYGNVHMLYSDWNSSTGKNLNYLKFNENGSILSGPIGVTNAMMFDIDEHEGVLHVIAFDWGWPMGFGASMQYVRINGTQVSTPLILETNSTTPLLYSYGRPKISVSPNGVVGAVWATTNALQFQPHYIRFAVINESGVSAYVPFVGGGGFDVAPEILMDNSDVAHVSWKSIVLGVGQQVFYAALDKFGNYITTPGHITNLPTTNYQGYFGTNSQMGIDDYGNIFMTWSSFSYLGLQYMPAGIVNINGTANIGNTIAFELEDLQHRNLNYTFALSFGNSGFYLPDGKKIPLDVDDAFLVSTGNPAGAGLSHSKGVLDNGRDVVHWTIPNDSALIGKTFYASFVTSDLQDTRIRSVADAVAVNVV